ncbi:hypothetical protein AVEN_50662-1 [Araneus ventricosus]|uniref:Uncharacterized protein n=1 Tax=Araneus ventricosus TaxID=182803 RepID=A0A4Y2JIW2_ARAVE|nr:hypothetical protein AVEN_50662-1 [Araneus ventricosus]
MADLLWNRVSTLESSDPKSRTLPLGHRGYSYQVMFYQSFPVNPCVKDRFITRYDEVTLWVAGNPVLNFTCHQKLAPPYYVQQDQCMADLLWESGFDT